MSRTSGSGVTKPPGMPRPSANNLQLQWPATTPSGMPTASAGPPARWNCPQARCGGLGALAEIGRREAALAEVREDGAAHDAVDLSTAADGYRDHLPDGPADSPDR